MVKNLRSKLNPKEKCVGHKALPTWRVRGNFMHILILGITGSWLLCGLLGATNLPSKSPDLAQALAHLLA